MPDLTQRDLETEVRLARIEGKVDALAHRIDEALITQLKDHGKRINAIEHRQIWIAGWIAGAGAVGALLAVSITKVLGL